MPKNRFLVICFYLLVIFGGIFGLKNINMDVIPDVGENQCIVFTDWPGRSPQDVEDQVTYPLTVNLTGRPRRKSHPLPVRLRLFHDIYHLQGQH